MHKHIVEDIYQDSKKHGSKHVKIITNHLKILGTLDEPCEKGIDDDCIIITLQDAKMWRLEDICTCQASDCKCNDINYLHFDEIHVNVSKIVAFSLTK